MREEALVEALVRASRVLVVTGAGVSAESGIPTFRGSGGLWEGFRAEELATPDAFANDPGRVWRWYRWRRALCLAAEPNPAHRVIAEMDATYPEFLLATQNVDGLHPRAGSRRFVELHGSLHHSRCPSCARVEPLPPDPGPEDAPPPRCPCGATLRPHVVWFGETYWPGVLETALAFADTAEVALVAGTSARIWPPIAIALHAQSRGALLIDVNPDLTELSARADVHLDGPAGVILPRIWAPANESRASPPRRPGRPPGSPRT